MIPWASQSPQSKWHHDRFSCFRTGARRMSLYFTTGRPFPLKIAASLGGSGPQSWFPGSTRVLNPNGISISSAICAGLSSVTDWLTDHATRSVTTDCIYVGLRRIGDAVLVVKVIWQDRITAADGQFNRICHMAPMCPPIWAHLFTLSSPCLDSFLYCVLLCVVCMLRFVTQWGGPGGIEAYP